MGNKPVFRLMDTLNTKTINSVIYVLSIVYIWWLCPSRKPPDNQKNIQEVLQ